MKRSLFFVSFYPLTVFIGFLYAIILMQLILLPILWTLPIVIAILFWLRTYPTFSLIKGRNTYGIVIFISRKKTQRASWVIGTMKKIKKNGKKLISQMILSTLLIFLTQFIILILGVVVNYPIALNYLRLLTKILLP